MTDPNTAGLPDPNPNPNGWGIYKKAQVLPPDLSLFWKNIGQLIYRAIAQALAGGIVLPPGADPIAFLQQWGGTIASNAAGALTDAEQALAEIQSLINKVLGGTGTADDVAALINALGGPIDPSRLPLLPIGNISVDPTPVNLLANGGFDGQISLSSATGAWSWDSTVGRTSPGSATTTGTGVFKTLASNLIASGAGQKIQVSAWVKWTGVTASAGTAFQVEITGYAQGSAVGSTILGTVVAPAAMSDWRQITGTAWTVPAGVDAVKVKLIVTGAVTSGRVWFDDVIASKTGMLPTSAVSGLPGQLAMLTNVQQDLTGLQSMIASTLNPGHLSGVFPGAGVYPGASTFPGAASNSDVQSALSGVLTSIQGMVPNSKFQQLLDGMTSQWTGVPVVGATLAQLEAAMTLNQNNLVLQAANLVATGAGGVGAAAQPVVGGLTSFVVNILAGVLGGSGAPAANQTATTSTGATAVSTGQIQPPGGEKFHIAMAGATSGMTAPVKGETGQAVTWSPGPGTSVQFGTLPSGDGAFWCPQTGTSATVVYLSTQLSFPVQWVYGKFQFTNNSKAATAATFALAILKESNYHGMWSMSSVHMPLHFWTTTTNWAYTVWDSNGGGQAVLAQGTYPTALAYGTTYTMSAKLTGGGTALFTLPNGVTGRVTDPRIDSFMGPTAFIESYNPDGGNDNQVSVIDFQCGSDYTSAIS